MRKPVKSFLISGFLLLIALSNLSAQDKSFLPKSYFPGISLTCRTELSDYKIVVSNNSYVELEFYPQYSQPIEIIYNNETFTLLTFDNAKSDNPGNSGKPQINSRIFSIILPSEENNKVTIVDYDVSETVNINLAPVPTIIRRNPNSRDFENTEYAYIKDNNIYSQNKFFPEQIASVEETGLVRETVLGNLIINPIQYNSAAKTLRKYTRIRIRINFGSQPVLTNRKRSSEELMLLKNIAVNSNIAFNWISPKLAGQKDKTSFNSVMANGDWYRIEIKDNSQGTSSGIYKINKNFLESAGINLSGVIPKTIKMYGNGGRLLPEDYITPRPVDLEEIAIYIEGEDDGSFDVQDYILFYGRSINSWKPDSGPGGYKHYTNYYSKSNYYWIRINTTGFGKRMETEESLNNPIPVTPSSYIEKLFREDETSSLILEGNIWLGCSMRNGQACSWNNTLTGIEAGTNIIYKIKPASHIYWPYTNYMILKEEYSGSSPIHFPMGNATGNYGNWIWTAETDFTVNQTQLTNGEQSKFTAVFYTNSPDGEGYVDWEEIHYTRRFNSVTNDYLHFFSANEQGIIEYNVSPFTNNQIRIFDITSHGDVKRILPLSTGTNSVKFQQLEGLAASEYLVTGQNGYKTPTAISQRFPNQNLHGAYTSGASFIIITHKDFLQAAGRLKEKRESPGQGNPDYLKTYVFTTEQIYNEFSGGVLDAVAIRDFLKYCYDSWQEKPVYVCLMGDGDMDFRNILLSHINAIPAFQYTHPYMNEVLTYCSDDYYAMVSGSDYRPDIAIGRIPVQSLHDANIYLNKIDNYENPVHNGYWKNRIGFVADDGKTTSTNDGSQHTDQCERLAEFHVPESFEKIKMYLISYLAVITSQGRRKPDVTRDIIKNWNEGLVGLNFTGHGSPTVWTHEYVLEANVVLSQLNNINKYPFLTVASCDFSKFDNPLSISGGESFVIAENKGAIGSMAATRPTYGPENEGFNNMFWNSFLVYRDTLLLQCRFGTASFITKQLYNDINDQKFVLMCDPTLRAQIPRYYSLIDSINGLSNDTMKALSRIRIYGSVLHPDSSLWHDYNGKIYLKIFDVKRDVSITDEDNKEYNFKLPGGIIFSGTQNVRNGLWMLEFIVPKDISYLNKKGKLINYFFNNYADGSGFDTSFIVGGINQSAEIDTTGPAISIYLNTRNFRSGDIVNSNFKLIADLFDESGINTTGTIGHKLEAVIDNNENNKYDMTNFYNSDTTYKSGSLEYDFYDLAEGKHTLRLKAWDTYNNSSETETAFTVSSSAALRVTNVFNYPNPFRDKTSFTFQHNYGGNINIKIKIYTVSGRLIKEISKPAIPDKFVVIDWAGTDEDGEKLANGVYLYKLTVTGEDGKSETSMGKLAVLK
jgi:hypothetical protein